MLSEVYCISKYHLVRKGFFPRTTVGQLCKWSLHSIAEQSQQPPLVGVFADSWRYLVALVGRSYDDHIVRPSQYRKSAWFPWTLVFVLINPCILRVEIFVIYWRRLSSVNDGSQSRVRNNLHIMMMMMGKIKNTRDLTICPARFTHHTRSWGPAWTPYKKSKFSCWKLSRLESATR